MRTWKFALYPLLIAVWLVTPLVGDRVPGWAQWVYWVVLVSVSVLGVVVAVRSRAWVLGVLSVLTLFAWPILLTFALSAGGMG